MGRLEKCASARRVPPTDVLARLQDTHKPDTAIGGSGRHAARAAVTFQTASMTSSTSVSLMAGKMGMERMFR